MFYENTDKINHIEKKNMHIKGRYVSEIEHRCSEKRFLVGS